MASKSGQTGSAGSGSAEKQSESSVLFSLQELMSLEKSRVEEEEQHRRQQAEAATQARLDAERRTRAEQEQRLREEDEQRRQVELRRRMDEAQIEAAKHAEIEKRRLEEQHRLQMEAVAQQQAHERQIQQIQAQKRKGAHPALLGGIGVALLAAIVAIVFFGWIKPIGEAKEAVAVARTKSESIARSDWEEGLRLVAVAKAKDPSNKDLGGVETSLRQKIGEDDAAKAKEKDQLAKQKIADDAKIAELTETLSHTTDPKKVAELTQQLADAKKPKVGVAGGQVQNTAPPEKKRCPPPLPGVPLAPDCK
jgi:hypothetical protein